ncbi:hypothetical protein HKX48_006273, partial [Thoreauomyces humboldtii]
IALVAIPLLETLDLLFGCGAVARHRDPVFYDECFEQVLATVKGSKDVRKVTAGIKVFCGYVALDTTGDEAVGAVRQRALARLLAYLAHPYPMVRRASAENLYLALTSTAVDTTVDDDDIEDDIDMDEDGEEESADDILLSTDWDRPVAELKDVRDRLKTLILSVKG